MAGLVCSISKCQASSFQKRSEVSFQGIRVVSNIGTAPIEHLATYGYTDSSIHSMVFKMAPIIISLTDLERFVVVCDNVALTVIVNIFPDKRECRATLVSIRRPNGFHITGGTKVFKMKQLTTNIWSDCIFEYFQYSTYYEIVGISGDLFSLIGKPSVDLHTQLFVDSSTTVEAAADPQLLCNSKKSFGGIPHQITKIATKHPKNIADLITTTTKAAYVPGVPCLSAEDLAVLVQSAATTEDSWELHKQLSACEITLRKIRANSIDELAVLFDGKFHPKSEYVSRLKDQYLLNQLDSEIQRLRGTVSPRV